MMRNIRSGARKIYRNRMQLFTKNFQLSPLKCAAYDIIDITMLTISDKAECLTNIKGGL